MAEFVQFRAEEWMAELINMERIGLFDVKEIKSIANRRKEMEYKIQRKTKCKEDFLKYIQYELDLRKIIKARRKKRRISTKLAEIDHSQTQRVANLFKKVIFRFQDDLKLWMSFYKFCKTVKLSSLVSQMLVKMLQFHANKPDLWVFASKWEFEQCHSTDNARLFLTRGLRHHPSSHQLYQELFKLEIRHLKKTVREVKLVQKEQEQWVPDGSTKAIIEGKVVEIIYKSATEAIKSVDFKANLLKIADAFKAPLSNRNTIFQDVIDKHSDEELTWKTIAERKLLGLSCDLKRLTGEEPMEMDNGKKQKTSMRDRIQSSINVYNEAVKRINTVKMWSYYLDHVININDNRKSLPIFKAKLLQNAMEGAMSSGKMDEKYYLHWAEILRKSRKFKKQLEVLKRSREEYPKSVPIRHALLLHYFSCGKEEEGMKIFKEVAEDAVPLWKLVVKYLELKSPSKLEDVFKEGIQRGGDVALALKPDYIKWLSENKGIDEARRVFDSPEMQLPPCLELYYKMAELEASQPEISVQYVRKCYDQACSWFGGNNPNLWLDYIKFEMQHDIKHVNEIYGRAVKTLTPENADEFIAEYNKVKAGIAT